jgi:hypothetical protein
LGSERLTEFEALRSIRLPDSYRNFLLRQNGGAPETNMRFFDQAGRQVDVSVRFFFGIGVEVDSVNLAVRGDRMEGRFPSDFMAVADAPGGDFILLGVAGLHFGQVWFWEHEFEADVDESPDFRNMTFLASDFDEFVELLEPLDVEAWLEQNPGF